MIRAFIALALSAVPATAQDAAFGRATYEQYCAACHGAAAEGDGWLAPILDPRPADLTMLARENGGTFPLTRVVWRIDGRDPLAAHGGEMPVFGEVFTGQDTPLRSEAGQPILTDLAIADLVAYLESIQR